MEIISLKNVRIAAVVAAATLGAACATVTEEQLAAVESKANNALSEARSAAASANNAMNVAGEANEAARSAQATAETALSCCNDNADKIEQLLEKSVGGYK